MKFKFLVLLAIATVLPLAGCGPHNSSEPSNSSAATASAATPTNFAYEAANFLQEFNTGLQTALPTVDDILTATHNPKDAVYVNIASSLLNSVAAAQKAAASSNAVATTPNP